MNDLIVSIPEEKALTVFITKEGLDPYLQQIKNEVSGFVADVSTRKGREEIASLAHKISRSKTALDSIGKQLVDKLKEQPKLVDAERKRMRDYLDALKDDVRKPLTEWEELERQRVESIKNRIIDIKSKIDEARLLVSGDVLPIINAVDEIDIFDESWCEFKDEAAIAKNYTMAELRKIYQEKDKHEKEQAELERLRKEVAIREQQDRERRIAEEAAERAKKEAEEAAKQREIKLRMEAEKAKRQKLEAEERARNAELKAKEELRIAEEKAKKEKLEAEERARAAAFEAQAKILIAKEMANLEQKRREADEANRRNIELEISAALIDAGLSDEQAQLVISAVANGDIPHVKIIY